MRMREQLINLKSVGSVDHFVQSNDYNYGHLHGLVEEDFS